jgi:hypothetical protein
MNDNLVGCMLVAGIMFIIMTGIVCGTVYNLATYKIDQAVSTAHKG